MKPIKVNFKKIDGTRTSTTVSPSACKMYAQVIGGIELADFDNIDDYYRQVGRIAQDFVNSKNQQVNACGLELHKDFIEDTMLRECMKKIRSDNNL